MQSGTHCDTPYTRTLPVSSAAFHQETRFDREKEVPNDEAAALVLATPWVSAAAATAATMLRYISWFLDQAELLERAECKLPCCKVTS